MASSTGDSSPNERRRNLLGDGKLDRLDRTRRLTKALDVAEQAVAAFGASGYEDPDDSSLDVSGDKIVAETAMVLYASSHSGIGSDVRERVHDLAGSLVGPARSDAVLARAALHPSLAEGLAVPHVLLTRLGYPDPEVDTFLRSCAASLGSRGHELPPYGALEKLWIRDLWGLAVGAGEWRHLLEASVLGRSLDLLGGSREDGYAFTHELMYVTDFGNTCRGLPRSATRVLDDARAFLAVCVDNSDYDLAAETLLAWPFLGRAWCASATFVFRLLAAVEDEAGILPGGTTKPERLRTLTGRPRRLYALATAYHTAYVMGMLCAASLRSIGSRSSSTRPRSPGLDELDLDGELALDHPDVLQVLATLSPAERDETRAFCCDLAIARAVRLRRYGPLAELLSRLDDTGYATSRLVVHAKELLVRLAAGLSSRTEHAVARE